MMEIDPCPFCGHDNPIWEERLLRQEPPQVWLYCPDCGAAGPAADNHQDAADLWNERA